MIAPPSLSLYLEVMTMHGLRLVMLMVIAAVLLAGCGGQTPPEPTAEPPSVPTAAAQEAYPAPTESSLGSGYPLPTEPAGPGYPIPTDNPGPSFVPQLTVPVPSSDQVGVVTGKLLRLEQGSSEGSPFPADLYLGKVLSSSQGEAGLVELDQSTAPKALIDGQGTFVFNDVPTGNYGLMLNTPRGAVLLNKPSDASAMVVEVKGGQVTDLGELKYDLEGL